MKNEGNTSTDYWWADNVMGEERLSEKTPVCRDALSTGLALRLNSDLGDERPVNFLPLLRRLLVVFSKCMFSLKSPPVFFFMDVTLLVCISTLLTRQCPTFEFALNEIS